MIKSAVNRFFCLNKGAQEAKTLTAPFRKAVENKEKIIAEEARKSGQTVATMDKATIDSLDETALAKYLDPEKKDSKLQSNLENVGEMSVRASTGSMLLRGLGWSAGLAVAGLAASALAAPAIVTSAAALLAGGSVLRMGIGGLAGAGQNNKFPNMEQTRSDIVQQGSNLASQSEHLLSSSSSKERQSLLQERVELMKNIGSQSGKSPNTSISEGTWLISK